MSEKEEPKLPSFFTMATNFTKELVKYAAQGAPNVSPENYIKRLGACEGCPFFQKSKMRCGKCGCLIEHKAKWRTSDCPDVPSRWPIEMMITDNEHQTKSDTEDSNKA